MAKIKELTAKQKAFVHHYLLQRNITEAARLAGYKNPNAQGDKVFKHPLIQAEIAKFEQAAREKFELSQEKIINELIKIGFDEEIPVSIGDLLDWDEHKITLVPKKDLTKIHLRYIKSLKQVVNKDGTLGVQLEVKDHDKIAALKLLGTHIGMWKKEVKPNDDEGEGDQSGASGQTGDAVIERLLKIADEAPNG